MTHFTGVILIFAFLLVPRTGWSQGAGAGAASGGSPPDDAQYEFGFSVGNLLPNQIAGVTEIMGLGGVMAGMQLAPLTYAETGVIMGNGNGVQWKNVHLDFRIDIPIENLIGLAYVGADMTYFNGITGGNRLIFGGHAGGGVMTHLGGSVWGRADMKFSFSPGTTLYIGIGIEFRI